METLIMSIVGKILEAIRSWLSAKSQKKTVPLSPKKDVSNPSAKKSSVTAELETEKTSTSRYKFGARSTRELMSTHRDIQRVMMRAIGKGEMDFSVIEGLRTQERQDELYAQGRTTPGKIVTHTRKSRHTTGEAVDIVPYPIDWDDSARFFKLSKLIKECADELDVEIEWGYDLWGWDMPHWQLKR